MESTIDNKRILNLNEICLFDNFLTIAECNKIITETDSNLWIKSKVALQDKQMKYYELSSKHRTNKVYPEISFSADLKTILFDIKIRIYNLIGIQIDRFENWQLSKFQVEEKFDYHIDCGSWQGHPSGEREKTILIYLATPIQGGETHFRALNQYIKPVKGRLVVWNNLLANGNCNHGMIHAGLPVQGGTKITLNTWIRERAFVNIQQT